MPNIGPTELLILLVPVLVIVVIVLAVTGSRRSRYPTPPQNPPATPTVQHSGGGATRLCPFCAEEIRSAAVVCKHCKRDVPAG